MAPARRKIRALEILKGRAHQTPARDLLLRRLRDSFPRPAALSRPQMIDVKVRVPLHDLVPQDEWSTTAGEDDLESPLDVLLEQGDRLFQFLFDGGRPGGSWTTSLYTLAHPDDPTAFAFLSQEDEGTVVMATLEGIHPADLAELETQLFLNTVAGPDIKDMPAEISAAVSDDILEEGLVRLLQWQRAEYGEFLLSGDVPLPGADSNTLRSFVRGYIQTHS